jgi:hypothetical protein
MLPQEPGHFSQILQMLSQDPNGGGMGGDMGMGPGMAPGMAMGPDMGMGQDPAMMGGGMGMPPAPPMLPGYDMQPSGMMMDGMGGLGEDMDDPASDPANKEAMESLIRDYLFAAGRKRLEASLAYQGNIAEQNGAKAL